MDQGPDPGFYIAPGSLDRMQLIFSLKLAGDLVEARVADHRDLVLLACDTKAQLAPGRGVGPNMKRSSSSLHSACWRAAASII